MSDHVQYRVGYETKARKERGKLDEQIARRVARAVSALSDNLRAKGVCDTEACINPVRPGTDYREFVTTARALNSSRIDDRSSVENMPPASSPLR